MLSNSKSVLEVNNISKSFKDYSSEWHRVLSWFNIFLKPSAEHKILQNINFTVSAGEVVGIVGQNGAGKSTLLKIITGTLKPTTGNIVVNGRISAILELGMGFNPDLTGRENVYNTSGLMGYSKAQIDAVIADIEAFAEIDEYFDQPIRTYSSGMQMRVAFSVATAFKPEILIIDEALSVGDAYFQQKSMRKILEFKNSGVSILFVSHDPSSVKMLCDSAILIDNGNVIDIGEPKEIINFYQNMILKKSHQGDVEYKQEKKKPQEKKNIDSVENHASTGEVELINFSFKNEEDEEVNYIVSEHLLKICFTIKTFKELEDPHYGIIIRNKFGLSAFETNTYTMRQKTEPIKNGETVEVEFSFECNLGAADYSLSIGIGNKGYDRGSFEEYLLFMQDIEMIKVIENSDVIQYGGVTNLKPNVKLIKYDKNDNNNNVFKKHDKYIEFDKNSQYISSDGLSRPIMLIVETVNICNNDCIICAYSEQTRTKEIMSDDIFKKTILDYHKMNGGALSLTPVVGDVFLDKNLVNRYNEILKYSSITDISFTTNTLMSINFNEDDLKFILKHTTRIHISIYGMDKEEYLTMTKRDEYEKLITSVKRIISLVDNTKKVVFGFRSLKTYEHIDYENWICDNFGFNIPFASTNQFANWGVLDTSKKLPFDATWSMPETAKKQCLIPLVACQVFANGKVSFCPCDDFDNDEELSLGSIESNTLLELYNSEKANKLWNFGEKVPEFCKECSFYIPIDKIKENEFMFKKPLDFIGG